MGIKIIKVYEESDEWGTYKVREQENGIKVKTMLSHTQAYEDKMKPIGEAHKAAEEQRQKDYDLQKVINDKMKELAVEQLKTEGILDQDGNLIER